LKLGQQNGVVEKHNFCAIQQKILQISDFTKKWDLNPLPHGDVADNIAKMFAKKNSQKSDFASKNTIFPGPSPENWRFS
jgi:hypothetical protein